MPRPVAVEHPEAGLIGPVDEVMVRIHVQLVNQGGPELVNQATGFLFALPDGGETLGQPLVSGRVLRVGGEVLLKLDTLPVEPDRPIHDLRHQSVVGSGVPGRELLEWNLLPIVLELLEVGMEPLKPLGVTLHFGASSRLPLCGPQGRVVGLVRRGGRFTLLSPLSPRRAAGNGPLTPVFQIRC